MHALDQLLGGGRAIQEAYIYIYIYSYICSYMKHVTMPNSLITYYMFIIFYLAASVAPKGTISSGSVAGFSKELCFWDKIKDM